MIVRVRCAASTTRAKRFSSCSRQSSTVTRAMYCAQPNHNDPLAQGNGHVSCCFRALRPACPFSASALWGRTHGMALATVQLIDDPLIEATLEKARRSPRLRANHNFHTSHADGFHRFLNAWVHGTYVAPHRHVTVPKPEAFMVLRGELACFVSTMTVGSSSAPCSAGTAVTASISRRACGTRSRRSPRKPFVTRLSRARGIQRRTRSLRRGRRSKASRVRSRIFDGLAQAFATLLNLCSAFDGAMAGGDGARDEDERTRSIAPLAGDVIEIVGAREHNLQVDHLVLPKNALVVLTGPSGSGKIEPRVRHALRRRAAPLRGVALDLRAAVPRAPRPARRGAAPRALADDRDRAEERLDEPALDRRHDHRAPRLPARAVGARRRAALHGVRQAGSRAQRGRDRRRTCSRCREARSCSYSRRSSRIARASFADVFQRALRRGVRARPRRRRGPPARRAARRSTRRRSTPSSSCSTG